MPPSLMRITNYPHYCSTIYCGPSGTQRGFAISCPPFGPPLGRSPPASLSESRRGQSRPTPLGVGHNVGAPQRAQAERPPKGRKASLSFAVLSCPLGKAQYMPPPLGPLWGKILWAIYYVPLLCLKAQRGPEGRAIYCGPKGAQRAASFALWASLFSYPRGGPKGTKEPFGQYIVGCETPLISYPVGALVSYHWLCAIYYVQHLKVQYARSSALPKTTCSAKPIMCKAHTTPLGVGGAWSALPKAISYPRGGGIYCGPSGRRIGNILPLVGFAETRCGRGPEGRLASHYVGVQERRGSLCISNPPEGGS